MQLSNVIAALVAPTLGPVIWWLLFYPGRKASTRLWQRLPDGKLRNFLLYKIPGTDETKIV